MVIKAVQQQEDSEFDSTLPMTQMSQDIDWLHCQASLCKVNLYNRDRQNVNKERKLVCFVDVSSLNEKDKYQESEPSSSQSSDFDSLYGFDLEEKEVIVIKDDNKNPSNTEGSVCFFKQGHCHKGDVVKWLSNDLQKYAAGFQHALTPLKIPPKSNPSDSSAEDKTSQHDDMIFNCSDDMEKGSRKIINKNVCKVNSKERLFYEPLSVDLDKESGIS
ncbi:UNVERIFIED_CONTAM: hypothetical protein K2H54_025856 [Gekko kuhli]